MVNGQPLLTPAVTRVELLTQAVRAVCRNLNATAADRAAIVDVLVALMERSDEQATLERAMGYLGLAMVVLIVIGVPVIVFVPALRLAAGVLSSWWACWRGRAIGPSIATPFPLRLLARAAQSSVRDSTGSRCATPDPDQRPG